jgi:long-chain acyl-CoA synthetase
MKHNFIESLLDYQDKTALIFEHHRYSFKDLVDKTHQYLKILNQYEDGFVIAIIEEYGIDSIACLFACLLSKKIAMPISNVIASSAGMKFVDIIFDKGNFVKNPNTPKSSHSLLENIKAANHSGLIYLTSGTGGEPKVVLHDFNLFFEVMVKPKNQCTTILYLKFDHFGGFNSLLPFLINGSTVIIPKNKNPEFIFSLIEKFSVNLLPVTPTFLSMSLAMGILEKYNLSSLQTITYGAEPCQNEVLISWKKYLPNVIFHQTYGMTETGTLKSKNKNDNFLYISFNQDDIKFRIINGKLEIKPRYLMLGYLNAPSPLTEDNYLVTNDLAESSPDGYLRIYGRQSELIYISGEKISPHEVEQCIMKYPGIFSVKVYGRTDTFFGTILCADIYIDEKIKNSNIENEIQLFCVEYLPLFKVPAIINLYDPISSNEVKKIRFKG